MNQESMEELVVLINRMKEIVERDPSMMRIGRAVSRLESAVMNHVEARILRMYRESRRLEAEGVV